MSAEVITFPSKMIRAYRSKISDYATYLELVLAVLEECADNPESRDMTEALMKGAQGIARRITETVNEMNLQQEAVE